MLLDDTSWGFPILRTGPSLGLSPGTRKAGVPRKTERGEINMKLLLKNLMTEDSGQDLIEYALVAALVGLGAVGSLVAETGTDLSA